MRLRSISAGLVLFPSAFAGGLPTTAGANLELAGTKGVTLLFLVYADCPIAKQYSSEMAKMLKLVKQQRGDGYVVFLDPDANLDGARRHLKDFKLGVEGVLDPAQTTAQLYAATAVPTSVVLRNGKPIYIGRIDDRFPALGVHREPRVFDLKVALTDAFAGRTPKVSRTKVIGCSIG